MGGRVFIKGINALYVPRLAPPTYRHVTSKLTTTLGSLFPRVSKPVDGPTEKKYNSDVDLVVSLEGSRFSDAQKADPQRTDIWAAIDEALKPERTVNLTKLIVKTRSLAIPWPQDLSADEMKEQLKVEARHRAELKAAEAKAEEKAQANIEAVMQAVKITKPADNPQEKTAQRALVEDDFLPPPMLASSTSEQGPADLRKVDRYIQLDIRLCDTTQELEWHVFKQSHGPFWLIMGATIRPLGLLVDDKGLQLSLADHEKRCSKASRIFLTNDPKRVLDFLGLSYANGEWDKPFVTLRKLVEYVETSRWYRPGASWIRVGLPGEDSYGPYGPGSKTRQSIDDNLSLRRTLRKLGPADTKKHSPLKSLTERLKEVRHAVFEAFPGTEQEYNEIVGNAQLQSEKEHWIATVQWLIDYEWYLPSQICIEKGLPEFCSGHTNEELQRAWRHVLKLTLKKLLLSNQWQGNHLETVKPPQFEVSRDFEPVKNWIRQNWQKVGNEMWNRVQRELKRNGFQDMTVFLQSIPLRAPKPVIPKAGLPRYFQKHLALNNDNGGNEEGKEQETAKTMADGSM